MMAWLRRPMRAPLDPTTLVDGLVDRSRQEVEDICKELQNDSQISREDVYYHVIYRVFGLRGGVSSTTEIDGGWLTRRNTKKEEGRLLELLTTKAPWCNWNLFGQIYRARESRLVALDATMLPHRTRLLLNEDWDLYESLATNNSRKLYEEILSASVRPRLQAFASSGRTPVNISLFDQYAFSMALYALAPKRDQEHYNRAAQWRRDYKYEVEVAMGSLTAKTIYSKGVFFQLLHEYLDTFFPRDGPSASSVSTLHPDGDRGHRIPFESEKLLRIFIEMWLEQNATCNPTRKNPELIEASDCENKLFDRFYPPSLDSLHSVIIMVGCLMARSVELDHLAAATRLGRNIGRYAGPPPWVLEQHTLWILHQPLFIFLLLIFRNINLETHTLEFCLTVDLWLTWLQPWKTLAKMDMAPLDRGAGPPCGYEKDYVLGNYNFYTTLLVSFIRKIREAFSNPSLRHQEAMLLLLRRVLAIYRTETMMAVHEASEVAARYYEGGVQSHRAHWLQYHLDSTRLTRSRPVTLTDPQYQKNAEYLRDELLAIHLRIKQQLNEKRSILTRLWGWCCRTYGDYIGGGRAVVLLYHEPVEDLQRVQALLLHVVEDINSVFCLPARRPGTETDLPKGRDAERTPNALLTARGKRQILKGERDCDSSKAFQVDRQQCRMLPRSYEVPWMVETLERWSDRLNQALVLPLLKSVRGLFVRRPLPDDAYPRVPLRWLASQYVWVVVLIPGAGFTLLHLLRRALPAVIRVVLVCLSYVGLTCSVSTANTIWWTITAITMVPLVFFQTSCLLWLSYYG